MVSEHTNARLFFSQFESLAQSTLTGYRWQIQQIYSHHNYGSVPWDVNSGHTESSFTHKFIDRLITKARSPQSHAALDHVLYVKLVQLWQQRFWSAVSVSRIGQFGPRSTLAMAAAACFLRGTAGRPQDLVRLRRKYIYDRQPHGLEFIYPESDPDTGKSFSRKGRTESAARTLLMPECLDDGMDIAQTFRSYMSLAPKSGPLFQKTTPTGSWSGKGWSASTVTDKLRKALSEADLQLNWTQSQIKCYSAHSFRSTAATSMAGGKVPAEIIAKALHHKSSTVTAKSYIHPTASFIRSQLSVTGSTV